MADWNLHYSRWMIEDGLSDRNVGEILEWFAVEFWSEHPLSKSDEHAKETRISDDYRYVVTAQVICVAERAVVIDFGLPAVGNRDRIADDVRIGDFVTGELSLGLAHSINEIPNKILSMLPRQWRVNRMIADLTPYVPEESGSRFQVRDKARISYQEVSSTDAVQSNDYVLECTDLGPSEFKAAE